MDSTLVMTIAEKLCAMSGTRCGRDMESPHRMYDSQSASLETRSLHRERAEDLIRHLESMGYRIECGD